jgi:hypothetical protein
VTTAVGHRATEKFEDAGSQRALTRCVQQLHMRQTTINVHEPPFNNVV